MRPATFHLQSGFLNSGSGQGGGHVSTGASCPQSRNLNASPATARICISEPQGCELLRDAGTAMSEYLSYPLS